MEAHYGSRQHADRHPRVRGSLLICWLQALRRRISRRWAHSDESFSGDLDDSRMGKDKGGIWGTQEKKKGAGGGKKKGGDDDDEGPKMGKKEAAAKAKLQEKMKAAAEQGVQSMDCRHILVDKHGEAVKVRRAVE
jgi:hypothetical protein